MLRTILLLGAMLIGGCTSSPPPSAAIEANGYIPAPSGAVEYCARHPEDIPCRSN